MKKTDKQIPEFKNEDEEREFWKTHSPHEYIKSGKARKAVFKNLKPSLKSISIRLPEGMLAEIKSLANKQDVPYQSLIKIYLSRQIEQERESKNISSKKKPIRVLNVD